MAHTTPTQPDLYQVSLATLTALDRYLSIAGHSMMFDCEPPSPLGDHWAARLARYGSSFHVTSDGKFVTITKINDHDHEHHLAPEVLYRAPMRNMGVCAFASMLCSFIIGKPSVPMESRSEIKECAKIARRDARYYFRSGMTKLIVNGFPPTFRDADQQQRWEMILDAHASTIELPFGTRWYYRSVGVSMDWFDVYDDAHHEEAVELLSTLGD